jgi:Lectin C-type domain
LGAEFLWIAATDLGQVEGDFYWDGIGDVLGPYSNWDSLQPNNVGGIEHCVVMVGTTQFWHDKECSNLYRFLCEGKIEEDTKFNNSSV